MIHPDDITTILCYGDSNTFGYVPGIEHSRYSKEIRWPRVLGKLLGNHYEIIEEGLNGRTTAYDRDGESFQNGLLPLKSILGTHKPIDIVIFMLGTNDCNKEMNLEPEDIRDGMEKLILKTKEVCLELQDYIPNIVIVSPACIWPEIKGTKFEDQLDETSVNDSRALAPLYKELSNKYNCLYFDASNMEVSKIDCEHLTVKGHQDLAYGLYELLKENN